MCSNEAGHSTWVGAQSTLCFGEYYRLGPKCRKQAITGLKNGWERGLETPLPQKSAPINSLTFESPPPFLKLMADTERESTSVATAIFTWVFFSFSKQHLVWALETQNATSWCIRMQLDSKEISPPLQNVSGSNKVEFMLRAVLCMVPGTEAHRTTQ